MDELASRPLPSLYAKKGGRLPDAGFLARMSMASGCYICTTLATSPFMLTNLPELDPENETVG